MNKQPDYRIYPSLLDKFQQLLEARAEFESFFNEDGEGGYKRTYDEVVADIEQQLIDTINRVPHAPIEAADKGTAFNEIVDCIVHRRKSTNPDVAISKEPGIIRAQINGFDFAFDMQMCKDAARYFKGSISQHLVSSTIETSLGTVELYGYLDELRSDIVYDIKTTSKYEFGKFEHKWQRHVYPYCLINAGECTEITEFEYTVFVLKGPTKAVPYITATMYRERYDFDFETSKAALKGMCEEFLEWLEAHRELITNQKIFNNGNIG